MLLVGWGGWGLAEDVNEVSEKGVEEVVDGGGGGGERESGPTFWDDAAPDEGEDELRVFPDEAEVEWELEGCHPDSCLSDRGRRWVSGYNK